MKLPIHIADMIGVDSIQKWDRQFVANGRQKHEGIWRRTQCLETAHNSNYKSPSDARWKMVHFIDQYKCIEDGAGYSLVIEKPYLWWNTALPKDEMSDYLARVESSMKKGGWMISSHDIGMSATNGDLVANVKVLSREEAGKLAGRNLPEGYQALDIEAYGLDMDITEEEKMRPWEILKSGIRKPLEKGNPEVASADFDLSKYVPFHVELGCGSSVEAGIPPLSTLHKAYAISNPKTHEFLIGDKDDLPEKFFIDTKKFYANASIIYSSAIKSHADTPFYRKIKDLFHQGKIIEPVFTNNYDGLISEIGLKEHYMRRFEEAHIYPDVEFDSKAKALVVIGSHADRRKLQEKARSSGLKIIYVDPETYVDEKGAKSPYPVEAPQDEDIVIKMTADEFTKRILNKL